mgnify:FL=1
MRDGTGTREAAAGPGPDAPDSRAGACLARVPLTDVSGRRDRWLEAAFTAREREEMAGRPDRTVAGRLALKQALADLWPRVAPGVPATPADFVLGRFPSGAPRLVSAPPGLPPASVRVSISHSPGLAVGLAAAFLPGGRP